MKYFFEKLTSKKVIFCLSFLAGVVMFAGSASAATIYVNASSTNAASNPNRPFNDPLYSPSDSFNNFSDAYDSAKTGDVIELSGGLVGQSYVGLGNAVNKTLTIQGSSIVGFSGNVTITENPVSLEAMQVASPNVVLQKLTFSGSNLGRALDIRATGVVVNNSTMKDPGGVAPFPLYIQTGVGASVVNFTNVIISGSIALSPDGSQGIRALTDGTLTVNFNNCDVVNVPSRMIRPDPGVTMNFTNCVFALNQTFDGLFVNFSTLPTLPVAVVNIDHSAINGWVFDPHVIHTNGTGTLNLANNNLMNVLPTFQKTAANTGFIALSTDDSQNLDYFTSNANYAMTTYGIPLTFYVNTIAPADKGKLQTLVEQGHEIGAHTIDHNDLSLLNAVNIKYTGTSINQALTVSANATLLSVTGTADTFSVNLATVPGNTIGGLCTSIASHLHYTCVPTIGRGEAIHPGTPSFSLKDATTPLPQNVTSSIPFDDSTAVDNRYFAYEITSNINAIQAAIREDTTNSSTVNYVVKTFAFPFHDTSLLALNWIKQHTNLIGIRANDNDSIGNPKSQGWLGSIDVFNIYFRPSATSLKGPNFNTETPPQQLQSIQEGARAMASYASGGFFSGALSHDQISDLSNPEWSQFLDELVKYRSIYNLKFDSFANLITNITTSGQWNNAGAGIWTRNFTGNDNLQLATSSPLIDAGVAIPERLTDYLGNTIVGNPDIGAFEFAGTPIITDITPPTVPGTPSAATPGTDNTPTWNWAASTDAGSGVSFYTVSWSTSSTFGAPVFTATTTANTFTHLTSLADGTWFFRVKATDVAGNQSVNSNSGSIVISTSTTPPDTTPPFVPGTPSATTLSNVNIPNWTWAISTDTGSGVAFYTVNWSTSSTFGSGVFTASTTANTFTHATPLADGTWFFRVSATDHANNQSANSGNGSILINATTTTSTPDVTPPTTPGTPAATTPVTNNLPNWTWATSTDNVGVALYLVSWSQDAGFATGVSTSTVSTNSFTHTNALANGTWFFRVQAFDAAGNSSTSSNSGSITIAVSAPLVGGGGGGGGSIGGGGGGGGGGIISGIFRDLFRFNIDKDNRGVARSRFAILRLFGGAAKRMAISNRSDFLNAVQEPYSDTRQWDLCSNDGSNCGNGSHAVYVKFYNSAGDASTVISDAVVLDTTNPTVVTTPAPKKVLGVKIVALKKTLGMGSRGTEVITLQNFLKDLGFLSTKIKSDGRYGLTTKNAVAKYQKSRGIKPATGTVGPQTRKALLKGI